MLLLLTAIVFTTVAALFYAGICFRGKFLLESLFFLLFVYS